MRGRMENGKLVITLDGIIDSTNVKSVEKRIQTMIRKNPCESLELNCDKLEYFSSAGLRMVLRLKNQINKLVLTDVHTELYEILDMTGFVQMMEIERAYHTISLKNCKEIACGANGKVYRINEDRIVKVYLKSDALSEIRRHRELARLAFVEGIPTAISYEVVRIKSGGYGSVFELLNASSFAELLIDGQKSTDEIVEISSDLLKLIHSKQIRSEILPDMKGIALDWVEFLREYLPVEQFDKLYALVDAVPDEACVLHGDYHLKNILMQDDEALLIDMDTLCHGHPIFELAGMYNAYVGFGIVNPQVMTDFMGLPKETLDRVWRGSLERYLGTQNEKYLREVEDKARVIGLTRLMRREIRRNGLEREEGRKMIEACQAALTELLTRIDTLVF